MAAPEARPMRLQTMQEAIHLVRSLDTETHLLMGFGDVAQYDNLDNVEARLQTYFEQVQRSVGQKKWILLYGGDPAKDGIPDVGLLVRRLARRWGCYVLAPLLQLGPEPPEPESFLSHYCVLQPEYEDEVPVEAPPVDAASERKPDGPAGGPETQAARRPLQGCPGAQGDGGARDKEGRQEPEAPAQGPLGQQRGDSNSLLGKRDRRAAMGAEQGLAVDQGVGQGGGPVEQVDKDEGKDEEPATSRQCKAAVSAAVAVEAAAAVGQDGGQQQRQLQPLSAVASEGEDQQQQQQQIQGLPVASDGAAAAQRDGAPSAAAGGASDAGTRSSAAGGAASDTGAGGSHDPRGGCGESDGTAAGVAAGDGGAAAAVSAADAPASGAAAGAAGGAAGATSSAQRRVLWGGIRNGRPVGPSALLLHDELLARSDDPGGRRLLTSVLVAGGGQVALQELKYVLERGVPCEYFQCRARKFTEAHGEFGLVDTWIQEQKAAGTAPAGLRIHADRQIDCGL